MAPIPSRLPTAPSQLYCEQFDQGVNSLFSDESRVQFVQIPFGNRGWCRGLWRALVYIAKILSTPDGVHCMITSPSEWDEIVQVTRDNPRVLALQF